MEIGEINPNINVVDRYLTGIEIGGMRSRRQDALILGIMEHIERVGVHSGDSIAVYPPQGFPKSRKSHCRLYDVSGDWELRGHSLVISDGQVYVLEVNLACRTVPFIKITTFRW